MIPINTRYFIIFMVVFFLFSCSGTRLIEKRQTDAAYDALGLKKERKDNVLLYKEAASWLHVPHVEGGTSRNGTDCSYLVQYIYKTVYEKNIKRNSLAILQSNCRKLKNKTQLREGDLVFFNTGNKSRSYINHVGIYLKYNKFLHASTSRGVIVSDLNEDYYRKTWVCGGRVK
jgi:probable lipoprotein NlpC